MSLAVLRNRSVRHAEVGHFVLLLLLRLVRLLLWLQELEEIPELGLEQACNRGMILLDERRLHKSVRGVLDEFAEVYHQTPRVRATHLEALEHDHSNLLLNGLTTFFEQVEDNDAEIICVAVRVA